MNFIVQINTGNAAFDDDPRRELARILQVVVHRLLDDDISRRSVFRGKVLDENGNTVGAYCLVAKGTRKRGHSG